MPPEMSEHGGESSSVDAPAIANAGAAVDAASTSLPALLQSLFGYDALRVRPETSGRIA